MCAFVNTSKYKTDGMATFTLKHIGLLLYKKSPDVHVGADVIDCKTMLSECPLTAILTYSMMAIKVAH